MCASMTCSILSASRRWGACTSKLACGRLIQLNLSLSASEFPQPQTPGAILFGSFGQPSQAERREALLLPLNIRVRDVQQSPDGYIYVVTEQASGRTGADGMVLRIEPNAAR